MSRNMELSLATGLLVALAASGCTSGNHTNEPHAAPSHGSSASPEETFHKSMKTPEGGGTITYTIAKDGLGTLAVKSAEEGYSFSAITCRKDGGAQGVFTLNKGSDTTTNSAALDSNSVKALNLCHGTKLNTSVNLMFAAGSLPFWVTSVS